MEKYLFILGSNWQLSIAELDDVLKHSRFKGRIVDYSANVAVVEFDDLHSKPNYVNLLMELQFILGGIQKIAQIIDFIDIRTMTDAFPMMIEKPRLVKINRSKVELILESLVKVIFPKIKNEKIFFAISIYPNMYEEQYYPLVLVKHFLPYLNKTILEQLKALGARNAIYYQYPSKNIATGKLNPIFPHHVIKYELLNENRAEIIFGFTEEGVYLARTFTVDDPNFKRKIDENRPSKDFKSSISPKLSTIMLNLLNLYEVRESKRILDPFVGNGTILMFALLQGFKVYGIDVDPRKVKNTIRNTRWMLKELEDEGDYNLNSIVKQGEIRELSSLFQPNFFDGVITEPEIGPFFKKKPSRTEITGLINNQLNSLYIDIFRECKIVLKPNKHLCIIGPIFSLTDGKDLQINIENIAREYNFTPIPLIDTSRIVNKSNYKLQFKPNKTKYLIDAKHNQIVKRKIYLFKNA